MTVELVEAEDEGNKRYCLSGSYRKCELVLHWKQIAAIWISFFITSGVTYHSPPVMLPAIMKEFGTDQFHISWLPAIFQLLKGVFTLPGGYAVDFYGCTVCLRAGAIVLLVASAMYPVAPNLMCLAALHGIYGFSYDLSGVAAGIVFVTSWFEQQRALGIAILTTAFSMSGVGFPPLIGSLIEHHGWRAAAALAPMLMLLVVVPLAFLLLRDGPLLGPVLRSREPQRRRFQAMGRCEPAGPEESRDEQGEHLPLNFSQSLRFGAVWHMAFLNLYELYIIIAIINTLVLYLQTDVGMGVELCGLYSSIVFQASTAAKLVAGAAMDSKQSKQFLTGMLSCLVLLLGTLLPLDFASGGRTLTSNHSQLLAFAVIYGLGFGASYSVLSSKPAKMFGRMADFSKLQGFFMLFQVIGGFLGTLVTGKLRAMTGSYATSFHIFILMAAMACLHYLALECSKTARILREQG